MCMTSQRSGCPDHPAHRPTVARLTGFKRRGRTKYRSQLLSFQWIYERTGARRALFRLRTLVEARSAPEPILGHCPLLQELRWLLNDGVGAPRFNAVARAEITPGRNDGTHRGSLPRLDVAQIV